MKRLFTLLISAVMFYNSTAKAATVTNYITDGFGNPLNTRIIVTPFTITTVFGGTNVLGPSVGFQGVNGFWQFNAMGGFYYVDQGLGQPPIVIWTTPGDTQTNSFAYFASAATNPIPSFFFAGQTNAVTLNNFNANQFNVVANTVSIKAGALQTNIVGYGYATFNGDGTTNGVIYIYDWTGTNIIAGYDTNYAGWFGNYSSTNNQYFLSTWPGPTNTLTMANTYVHYSETAPTSITNLGNVLANQYQWETIVISNSTAASVTQWCTVPAIRFFGTQSTNGLVVAAGKAGIWSFQTIGQVMSNCVNAAQQ